MFMNDNCYLKAPKNSNFQPSAQFQHSDNFLGHWLGLKWYMLKDLTDLKDYFAFLDYSISELQSLAMFHGLNIQCIW